MRHLIFATALVALTIGPALAQSPAPRPHPSKTPFQGFTRPSSHGSTSASGSLCNRNGIAAQQQTINPITGQPQAQTIVSVPVTKGAGSVASATTRQQQLEACAHSR